MVPALLSAVALAADPGHLTVTYTVHFDLPPAADQVCGSTGFCDCTLTWSGTGAVVSRTSDHVTFLGTYKVTEGQCTDAFTLWTPPDGKAYQTIRTSPDGAITEWIAHAKASDTTRFPTDIKARGQVWVAGMNAAVDPATHTATYYERDSGPVGPFTLTTEHHLTLQLLP